MTDLPEWVLNPDDPATAAAIASDIAGAIARKKLEQIADAHEELLDYAEIAAMPRFQADVAFDTMRTTAKLQAAMDRSINHQAVRIIDESLYLHHANEYETAEQFFEEAIGDIDRSQSEISDLRTYHDQVLPYLKRAGKNGASHLWVKGQNVAKARAAAPVLRNLFEQINEAGSDAEKVTELQARVEGVVEQLIDSNVTKRDFIAKLHETGEATKMGGFSAWKFLQGQGSVLVMLTPQASQQAFVEQALGDYAEWHLGTGKEPVLALLGVPVEGFVEEPVAS